LLSCFPAGFIGYTILKRFVNPAKII